MTNKTRRSRLGELDWKVEPQEKRRYVSQMFDVIAPRYDTFTRWFSYGMDAGWKHDLLALATSESIGTVVDLACGTGDLLEKFVQSADVRFAIGVDLSLEMAIAGMKRTRGQTVLGDLAQLPIASGAIDLVTVGYGFRNTAQFEQAIAEAYRILRPGGRLLVLDFYQPPHIVWRTLFHAYLIAAGSIFGLLFHGEAAVYRYIATSIQHYVTVDDFERVLQRAGFGDVEKRIQLFGGIALHRAAKGTHA